MPPETTTDTLSPPSRYATVGSIASRFARHLELALAPLEMTSAQYRMLVQLAQGSDASSSLAKKLAVSPPSVTTVVDGLVQRGAIERTPSAEDRRRISLALTAVGVDLLAQAEAALAERFEEIADALADPDAAHHALDALGLWAEALDNYRLLRAAEREDSTTQEIR